MVKKIHPRSIHSWNVNLASARKIQLQLAEKLVLKGELNPSLIAGADCAFSERKNLAYAVAVVYDLTRNQVIEVVKTKSRIHFPYVPGYLSFREGPALLKAFSQLKTKPEAIIFDGQGVAHPRRMGIASHLGLWLKIPSLGCAKTRLYGDCKIPGPKAGSWEYLFDGNNIIGAVVRTRDKVKPVFVSPGHLLSLESAIRIVLNSVRGYRIPEPARLAHLFANRFKKEDEQC